MTRDTLTDRYVAESLSHLARQDRDGFDEAVRATIGARIVSLVEGGADPETAEYAVLAGLGDPAALAARYRSGTGGLIGARMFQSWTVAVRWACGTVLPALYLVLAIVFAVNQDNIWVTVFRPVGIVITVGAYLLVAVTAVYHLIDRAADDDGDAMRWTPEKLTDPR